MFTKVCSIIMLSIGIIIGLLFLMITTNDMIEYLKSNKKREDLTLDEALELAREYNLEEEIKGELVKGKSIAEALKEWDL